MTDKEYEKQKNRTRKYVLKWRNLFGLWNWEQNIGWADTKKAGKEEGTESLADCYADWKYLNYSITFYLPSIINKSDREVERMVVHEMCHVLVNEMREHGVEHEERVVSHLTNVLETVYSQHSLNKIKQVKKKVKK